MSRKKITHIENVGAILFERSRKAKRIIISIKPKGEIRVAVPYASSFKKAEEFVNSKTEWIIRHLDILKRYKKTGKSGPGNEDSIDKIEAKKTLTERLESLARKHGFSYNRVFIRNQKTRWGSCSSMNNISLNVKLARLPDELIDYVIMHELVHTRIKNHGRSFWEEMGKYLRNAKEMCKTLRKHGQELY
ncbi:MAG: M48 family metallopeptidase [Deltaproteobacteria bacterium]|nr:M48 family metallopeptidase [Deltaproteobacteria bacterium]